MARPQRPTKAGRRGWRGGRRFQDLKHCSNCCTCPRGVTGLILKSKRSAECPGVETFAKRKGTRGGHTAIACPRPCRVCKSTGHPVVTCPEAGSDPAGRGRAVAPWIRNLVRNRKSQGRGDEVGRGKVLGESAASGGAGQKTSYGHEETEWSKTRTA